MSSTFIVSARKYRPDTWDTVVGQRAITTTLRNAIANQQVAQAYLFCGPRGVGKTTCARIFARAVNGAEVQDAQDLAFNVFELDAASNNSVDDIRQIVDTVRIPPQQGKYKVYIIDEVHMLSSAAFNAFLKTLEEPPAHAIFILATTEKHKILPTILSRCQVFDFNRIRVKDIADHLADIAAKEGIEAEPEALHVIAQKADGAMRDALSIFDQIVAFCGRRLTYQAVIQNLNVLDYEYYFRLTDAMLSEQIPESLVILDEVIGKGFDAHHFVTGLGSHLRNLLVCKDPATIPLLEVSENVASRYADQSARAELIWLVKALDFVNECDVQYRSSRHQRLLVELMLMKIASLLHNNGAGEKKNFRLKPFRSGELQPSRRSEAAGEPSRPTPVQVPSHAPVASGVAAPASASRILASPAQLVSDVPRISSLRRTSRAEREEQAIPLVVDMPTREYHIDEIRAAWSAFAASGLGDNAFARSAFEVAHLELRNSHTLRVAFPSGTQHIYFNEARGSLAEFFRNSHDILGLTFELDIQKQGEVKLTARTDREKFDAMRAVNPAVDILWKEFQLRID